MTDFTDDERPPPSFLAERLRTRKSRRRSERIRELREAEGPEEPAPHWFNEALTDNRRTTKAPFPDNNQPPDAA